MHEFLLFGQVASGKHHRLLQQLAGVTRMQPQYVLEKHLIFKGRSPPGLDYLPSGGGSQGVLAPELQRTKTMVTGQLYYIQLVCDLNKLRTANTTIESGGIATSGHETHEEPTMNAAAGGQAKRVPDIWTLEFRDTPEPGKQPVTTRLLTKSQIESGDVVEFVEVLGFEYVSQHIVEGHKFYDQDTTLFLHQVLQMPNSQHRPTTASASSAIVIDDLQPLDSGKSYVLQAAIEVVDGNNQDVKEKATQQLLAMKEILKQAATLEPVDRLSLDTRVLSRNVRS